MVAFFSVMMVPSCGGLLRTFTKYVKHVKENTLVYRTQNTSVERTQKSREMPFPGIENGR